MNRIALLVFLMAALPSWAGAAETADELVARNIAARGGAAQMQALHSLRLSGRLLVNGGRFELALTETRVRGAGVRSEASVQGLTVVQAYDGHDGWQINPFQGRKDPERLPPDDVKELADSADLDGAWVDYKAKGSQLEYLGTEDVDGTAAHKLRLSLANGDLQTVYLDPDAFLVIRIVNSRMIRGALQETVTDFGDYEQVAGVYVPLALETGPKGSQDRQKIEFDKAEGNVTVDPAVFHFPAAK